MPTDDQRSRDRFVEMRRVASRSQHFGTVVVVTAALVIAVVSSSVSMWNLTVLRGVAADTAQLVDQCRTEE